MRHWELACFALCGALLTVIFHTPAQAAANLPRQNLARFTSAQWITVHTMAAELPVTQRVRFWANLASVDAEYVADPLGEGPGQQPDADPLNDFAHVDCVTYVEQVYALALSTDQTSFADTLRRIRYRDGQIDYRWRNHYFVSDWLPANSWCIRDVTDEVGGTAVATMRKTIARGTFFAGKGLTQYATLPEETATTHYIPRDKLKAVAAMLRTGDLIIFVLDTPGIIAGHTGLLTVDNGAVTLQHASLTAKRVVTAPLADYLRTAPARFVGFKVARLLP